MKYKMFAATAVTILLMSNIVFAIPGIPHAFRGYVYINGVLAPDGTSVVARIDGEDVASTTTTGGEYGNPWGSFYVPDPDNDRVGEEITFFVDGIDTGASDYFLNGDATELHLEITKSVPTTTQPASSDGGGGGGGGGGSVSVQPCELNGICDEWETEETCPSDCATTTTTQPSGEGETTTTTQACQEKWTCGDWSRCRDGVKTRKCVDENSCGTDIDKPFDSQPCTAEEIEQSTGIAGFFTGMAATLTQNASYIIGLLAVVVAAILAMRMKLFGKLKSATVPTKGSSTKNSAKKTSGKK